MGKNENKAPEKKKSLKDIRAEVAAAAQKRATEADVIFQEAILILIDEVEALKKAKK